MAETLVEETIGAKKMYDLKMKSHIHVLERHKSESRLLISA